MHVLRRPFTKKELRDLYRALARQAERADNAAQGAQLRATAKIYAGRDSRYARWLTS